jgi:hypothetical protein
MPQVPTRTFSLSASIVKVSPSATSVTLPKVILCGKARKQQSQRARGHDRGQDSPLPAAR